MDHLLTGEAWEVLEQYLWHRKVEVLRELRLKASQQVSPLLEEGRIQFIEELLTLRARIREEDEIRKLEAETSAAIDEG